MDRETLQLLNWLHRGGQWSYSWTLEGKVSSWSPVGKPLAVPRGKVNVYFGVHPTAKPKGRSQRATIGDIAVINCLFADFDANAFGGSKATALERAQSIALPPSVIVDSGGGYHGYWLLAEPFTIVTAADRKRVQVLQATWVTYAGGDIGAKDLARVLRLPGTTNYKPDYGPDFPAVTFLKTDWDRTYRLAELETIATNAIKAKHEAAGQVPYGSASSNGHGKYIDAAIRGELERITAAPEGQRNTQVNQSAFGLGQLIAAGLDRKRAESALLAAALTVGLPERESRATVRSGLEAGEKQPRRIPKRKEKDAAIEAAEKASGYNLTDFGNAERFVARHGRDIRFCYALNQWFFWESRRWATDENGEIVRRAKETVRAIYGEAAKLEDDKTCRALVDHARRSEGEGRINAMIALGRSEPGIGITLAQLNVDPWLFNCQNGTIDLRTGELREHRREDLITKLSPVVYDPAATLELWDRFLDDTTQENQAVKTFLQTAAGYSLTGSTREEVLFFAHGPAAAGKSTFMEALKGALGDYAATADFETFLARNYVGGPRGDIARLAGARLCTSIEVDEGKRLAEGLVKNITGGDTVTARFLYHESFEFMPQFKLWLAANHAPKVRDDDDAIWRRILRVPFEHVVPKADRDPKIKEALRDPEKGGTAVLAWAVRGCLAWQAFGLAVPEVVEKATSAYRMDMDPLRDFISDCCVLGKEYKVAAAELRKAYEAWAEDNGEKFTVNARGLADRLRARACTQTRERSKRLWSGIGLKTHETEQSG